MPFLFAPRRRLVLDRFLGCSIACAGLNVWGTLFKDHAGFMELAAHDGLWWLHRNRKRHRHH
jgi:hypothetical protein